MTGSGEKIGEVIRRAIGKRGPTEALLDVQSEFELKAVRKIAREVARQHDMRLHSARVDRYQEPGTRKEFPCRVVFWDPDYVVTDEDLREAMRKLDASLSTPTDQPE